MFDFNLSNPLTAMLLGEKAFLTTLRDPVEEFFPALDVELPGSPRVAVSHGLSLLFGPSELPVELFFSGLGFVEPKVLTPQCILRVLFVVRTEHEIT